MSMNDLISKIEALNEWETLLNEAHAEAEALRDSIKAEMMARDTEELTAGHLSFLRPAADCIWLSPAASHSLTAYRHIHHKRGNPPPPRP